MSNPFPCQLILDPPREGAWNMALDEALLQLAADEGIATLRFYQWQEPTLSLGYFQKLTDRNQHPASLPATVVRRQSGGGAILHDRELTYSISLPAAHPLAKNAQLLYTTMHTGLALFLQREASNGVKVKLFVQDLQSHEREPFLCFQRRAEGDIVLNARDSNTRKSASHKIVGSAQRRSRGAVLQHGSILLEKSPLSPELPGFNDLCGTRLEPAELADDLRDILPQALILSCFSAEVCQKVHDWAERWYNERYGNAQWTTRR